MAPVKDGQFLVAQRGIMTATDTPFVTVGIGGMYDDWNAAASDLGTTGGIIIMLDSVHEITAPWEGVKLVNGVPTRANIITRSACGKTTVRAKGGSNLRACLCNTALTDGTITGSGGDASKRNSGMQFWDIDFDMNYPNNAPAAIGGVQILFSMMLDGMTNAIFENCFALNCRVATTSGTAYGIGWDTYDAYNVVMNNCGADNCDKNLWLTTNAPGDKINGRIRNFRTTNSTQEGVYFEAGVGWDIEVSGTGIGTHFIYMPTSFTSAYSGQFRVKGKCDGFNGYGFVSHCYSGNIDLTLYNNASTTIWNTVQIEASRITGRIELSNCPQHGVNVSGTEHFLKVLAHNVGTLTNATYDAVVLDTASYCSIDLLAVSDATNRTRYGVHGVHLTDYCSVRSVSSGWSASTYTLGANSVSTGSV